MVIFKPIVDRTKTMLTKGVLYGFISLAIALCLLTSGCIFNETPPTEATYAANKTAERVFQSFNTGDYSQFSMNFSDRLKSGINESSFSGMRNQILDKYGNYTSKAAPQGSVIQGYNNFVYDCSFEKGTMKIRLVMNTTNPSLVDGLWFPNGI